jgi:hypothetical protein
VRRRWKSTIYTGTLLRQTTSASFRNPSCVIVHSHHRPMQFFIPVTKSMHLIKCQIHKLCIWSVSVKYQRKPLTSYIKSDVQSGQQVLKLDYSAPVLSDKVESLVAGIVPTTVVNLHLWNCAQLPRHFFPVDKNSLGIDFKLPPSINLPPFSNYTVVLRKGDVAIRDGIRLPWNTK